MSDGQRQAFPFLSADWIFAAEQIRDRFREDAIIQVGASVNLVITDVPFEDDIIYAHVDSTKGHIRLDFGHLDRPDATVTTDYVTARTILVGQNLQAIMRSLMEGRLTVQGDLTKVMALQPSPGGDAATVARQVAAEIRAITSD